MSNEIEIVQNGAGVSEIAQPKSKSDVLWCIYIAGPDDLVAMPSKPVAEAVARNFNAVWDRYGAERGHDVRAVAHAEPWMHGKEAHGKDLREHFHEYADLVLDEDAARFKPAQPVEAVDDEVDYLHALDQAEVALGTAGLDEDDIFRVELRRAREHFAALAHPRPRADRADDSAGATPCTHCGGETEWFASMRNNSPVVDGRLKVSDVSCVFVRGCTECSETLEVRSADDVAASMSSHPRPTVVPEARDSELHVDAPDAHHDIARAVWEFMNRRSAPGVIMIMAYTAVLHALANAAPTGGQAGEVSDVTAAMVETGISVWKRETRCDVSHGLMRMLLEECKAAQPLPVAEKAGEVVMWQWRADEKDHWHTLPEKLRTDAEADGCEVRALYAQPFPVGVPDDAYYLQDSRSYTGNCPMWWAKDGKGYTTRLDQAHRYTHAEAMAQHRSRETDVPWPCAEIDPLRRPTVDFQTMRSLKGQIAMLAAAPGAEVQP